MKKNLDIRIIQLAKWKIPKSQTSIPQNSLDTYLSIGYFDMLDVKKIEYDDSVSPLLSAYNGLHRNNYNPKTLENYSLQELIVFTDLDEELFTQKRIDDFWMQKSLLLFVSLIHIDNESNIPNIIKKIHQVFKNINYLFYFSFDYSGIVIFAKEISIDLFLNKMFALNYDASNENKLIRDSYSLYGFDKSLLNDYYKKIDHHEDFDIENDSNLSIAINIGIQNYDTYIKFINELENINFKNTNIKKYGLLGRHDVSIVKEDANIKWLIHAQHLLNKYTKLSKTLSENMLFSTHETFVKVNISNLYFLDGNTINTNHYNDAKKRLNSLCSSFFKKLDQKPEKYNGEYKIPVQEVKYSILSIMKNRYAEDFVLCMYQSFYEFLKYLTEQMSQQDKLINGYDQSADEFNRCFVDYFRGLNSLVNSAMHSERQFIQATAFNAIIYDVPSKIMAFYVALIDDSQTIIRNKNDKKYTFLLTPSFHNEISVKVISFYPESTENPLDRILMVMINEKSLYNPKMVIRRMIHEVAHFVGDDLRCRSFRKQKIKQTIIDILLGHILHNVFLCNNYESLANDILNYLPNNSLFSCDYNNYSNNLEKLPIYIAKEILENSEIQLRIRNHIYSNLRQYLYARDDENKNDSLVQYINCIFKNKFGNNNIFNFTKSPTNTEIDVFVNYIMEDVNEELMYLCKSGKYLYDPPLADQSIISSIGSQLLNNYSLLEFGKEFKNIYSESFADLQMILLTNISYSDYLNGFINEENLDLDTLKVSIADLSRISMIAFILNLIGFWDISKESTKFEDKIKEFHHIVISQFLYVEEDTDKIFSNEQKNMIKFLCNNTKNVNKINVNKTSEEQNNNIINIRLTEYLMECIKKSLDHYKSRISNINQFRKTINSIIQFDNISNVFETVCEELNTYKIKLFVE